MSTTEGKCVLVEVGALISWCIYSYRIGLLLLPYMWASMTFLPPFATKFSLPLFLEKSPSLKSGTPVFALGDFSGKYCQIFVVKTRE